MRFSEQLEYENYDVEVDFEVVTKDGFFQNEIHSITITDELGNLLDESDDKYHEIYNYVVHTDFDVEVSDQGSLFDEQDLELVEKLLH